MASPSRTRPSGPKKVAFDKLIVTDIDCDFTQEESYAYWLQVHEYDRMRKRDRTIAKRVSQGNCDRNYCTHGLIDDKYRKARRTRVREAILSVVLEQEIQRGECSEDAESIAELYIDQCRTDLLLGLERASTLENQLREDGDLPPAVTKAPSSDNSKKGTAKRGQACRSPGGLVVTPQKSAISKMMKIGASERSSLSIPRQL